MLSMASYQTVAEIKPGLSSGPTDTWHYSLDGLSAKIKKQKSQGDVGFLREGSVLPSAKD